MGLLTLLLGLSVAVPTRNRQTRATTYGPSTAEWKLTVAHNVAESYMNQVHWHAKAATITLITKVYCMCEISYLGL